MQSTPTPEIEVTLATLPDALSVPPERNELAQPAVYSAASGSDKSSAGKLSVEKLSVEKQAEKQKVTLYFPPTLHRQLKIRAAVDSTPMSALVERAVAFYLDHSDVVDEYEAPMGQTHRVYSCPTCHSSTVIREGELVALRQSPSILTDDSLEALTDALTIERAIAARATSIGPGLGSTDPESTSIATPGSVTPIDPNSEDQGLLIPC